MKVNKAFRRRQRMESVLTRPLLLALQVRAREQCLTHGHALSHFTDAKKKFGKAAQRAWCERCGGAVFLLPFHEHSKEHPQVPAMTGDILFDPCQPK